METIEIENKAMSVPFRAKAILITDNETYIAATELLMAIKDIRKEIDETFGPIISKAFAVHKEAVGQKKKVEAPLVEAEGIIKPRIGSYLAEQEQIRLTDERRLQEEARKRAEEEQLAEAVALEASGESVAAEALIQAPIAPPPVILPKSVPKVSGVSSRKGWKWRLKDPSKVKREFLMVDEVKINSIVRSLGKNAEEVVCGIECYEETTIVAGRK